jgi:hypothetical protein
MNEVYRSQNRVNLVCGFYGPTHPKCKQAIDDDLEMYNDFMKQIQIFDDDDDDTSEKKN